MKTLIVYMISCCLLLFGGYRYAHGRTLNTGHSTTHRLEKAPQVRFDEFTQHPAFTAATPDQSKQNIVKADDEDEDADFGRKLSLPVRSLLVLVYAAFLLFGFDKIKSSPLTRRLVLNFSTGYSPVLNALRI